MKFAPEHNRIINEEVEKLNQDKFITEVYYLDWLANLVIM